MVVLVVAITVAIHVLDIVRVVVWFNAVRVYRLAAHHVGQDAIVIAQELVIQVVNM